MSDQKKLRELMKKEKERRAAEAAAARAQAPPRNLAVTPLKRTAAPQVAQVAQAAAAAADANEIAARQGGGGPPTDGAAAVGSPKSKRGRSCAAEADALAMPPPPAPSAAGRRGLAGATAAAEAAAATPPTVDRGSPAGGGGPAGGGPAPEEGRPGGAGPPGLEELQAGELPLVALESPSEALELQARAAAAEAPAEGGAEAEAGLAAQLPPGFFDNPEMDAKVRGVEAPSVRAQRQLEEGLKRFEREIAVETERAEETRHDLDETKYEEVAAEEVEFQSRLQQRLMLLRKRAAARSQGERSASPVKEVGAAGGDAVAEAEAADVGGDSGSDVEFDWRAKGFG